MRALPGSVVLLALAASPLAAAVDTDAEIPDPLKVIRQLLNDQGIGEIDILGTVCVSSEGIATEGCYEDVCDSVSFAAGTREACDVLGGLLPGARPGPPRPPGDA